MKFLIAVILSVAPLAITPLSATLFTIGGLGAGDISSWDEDTFSPLGGSNTGNVFGDASLATDGSRLYHLNGGTLLECDPSDPDSITTSTPGGSLNGLAVFQGTLFCTTGIGSDLGLVSFDAESLQQTGGAALQNNAYGNTSIATTSSGRVFAHAANQLVEFDPDTGAIINSVAAPNFSGLTAQGDQLFGVTGSSSLGLLAFDQDTLGLVAGTAQSSSLFGLALVSSQDGRLFANATNSLYEFDASSGNILNSRQLPGLQIGLAILSAPTPIPEPSRVMLLLIAGLVIGQRRHR